METQQFIEAGTQVADYVSSLDWAYIITFIIIAYGINHFKLREGLRIKTRYLIAVVGIIYGIVLYLIRGLEPIMAESLFQSFVFAMVFHKLLLDQTVNFILTGLITKQTLKNRLEKAK